MELVSALRETRLEKGLTQEALADAVGVTRQTIISIEKGKFVPSVKLALQLAHALQVPLPELFWLERPRGGRG